jgi:hypothetical protein
MFQFGVLLKLIMETYLRGTVASPAQLDMGPPSGSTLGDVLVEVAIFCVVTFLRIDHVVSHKTTLSTF